MKAIKCLALVVMLGSTQVWADLPKINGTPQAADGWLLNNKQPKWWFRSKPSANITMLDTRQASNQEQQVIDRAKQMMEQYPVKAIALIDGDKVLYEDFNPPAGPMSMIYGFSMGKTVTAMMVGQAICDGKLYLSTRAEELIPELKGKQLGITTVKDLLRMASGTKHEDQDGDIFTPEQSRLFNMGTVNLVEIVSEDRNSTAERGFFSNYEPGEHFAYKSSNPTALGIMVSRATGMSYAQWLQAKVLDPMGVAEQGVVAQDTYENGLAAGALSMRMEDWIRFAIWVKKSSQAKGCFGDFVREATKTQIANGPAKSQRKTGGKLYAGYGYLTWTENEIAPDSFWAVGYGGQRIGWFRNSNKMIIVFSNVENWMGPLYELGKSWNNSSE